MRTLLTTVAVAAAVTMSLTACGTSTDTTATPTRTASASASGAGDSSPAVGDSTDASAVSDSSESATEPVSTTSASTETSQPAGGTCLTADSPEVQTAMANLSTRYGWYVESVGAKSYPDCLGLQWVLLGTPRGTASSPYQVMFFHDNTFVSTANTFDTSYTSVVGETKDSVQVQYRWLQGDEPSCCPQGGPVTITYTWTGTAVGQDPPLPEDMVKSYSR